MTKKQADPVVEMVQPEIVETKLQQSATGFAASLERYATIESREMAAEAGAALADLARVRREIEAFFKPMKQEADKAKRAILDREKGLLKPIEEADTKIRLALGKWGDRMAVEAKARDAEAKRDAETVADLSEALGETVDRRELIRAASPSPAETSVPGVAYRTYYNWRVIDEKLIPREFLKPDDGKIDGLVSRMRLQATAACPGIEVIEKKVPVISGGRS